jgi:uncharacterized repeat protein (TIGR01451 family)
VDSLITIFLRPLPVLDATDWINAAEISGAQDLGGSDIGPLDMDSNYDDIQGNMDALEDDYDEASAFVYDLALRKSLSPSVVNYTYGDNIDFTLTVFNQGSDTVQDVQVREYFAEGFAYDQSLNAAAGWFDDEPIPYAIIPGPIPPGGSAAVTVTLGLTQMMFDGRAWDNYAGIDSAFTTSGIPLIDDADSNPGTNSLTENSVLPGSSDDDNILGGGPDAGEDEDDHDVASIEVFDFALIKLREATVTPSFSYGQTVIFNNTVFNQGNQDADSVIVVDYVPCGYRFVDFINPGWTYDSLARKAYFSLSPGPAPASDVVVPITLVVQPCFDDPSSNWVNNAELTAVVDTSGVRRDDIDSTPDDTQANDAGGVVDDGLTDNNLDGLGIIDEDDSDPATLEIVDWALKLTIDSPDTVRYGDNVRFKLTGYNQGNITFADTDVLIDLGVGYSYDPSVNPGWSSDMAEPSFTFSGPLAPGDSVEAFLDLTLLQTQNIDEQWINYAQLVQLRDATGNRDDDADSFPSDTPEENSVKPGDPDDDNIFALGTNFQQDQDDHDPAGPDIFDLALRKQVVQTGRIEYDDLLEFVITIENQGNQAAQAVTITDYLPPGLSFDSAEQNQAWIYDANENIASLTLTTPLDVDELIEVSIFLQVECVAATIEAWTNMAEISAAINEDGLPAFDTDSDYDTDPSNDIGGSAGTLEDDNIDDSGTDADGDGVSDEDDSDPAFVPVVDLALRKGLVSTPPYAVGDLIQFEVWVFNQGNTPLEDIVVVDYIADGYGFSAADNAGWTSVSAGATYTFGDVRLMPGDSTRVTLDLTYQTVAGGGVLADYINYAEILAAQDTLGVPVAAADVDSNPGSDTSAERAIMPSDLGDDDITTKIIGGNEDDHDVAGLVLSDLALDKVVVDTAPYQYGEVLTYEISITNQGTVPASNIVISDVIGCGLGFLPTNNSAWSYVPSSRVATQTIAGPLLAGETVTTTLQLELAYCDEAYDASTYNNEVEIQSAQDDNGDPLDDGDSTPGNDDPTEDDQDDEPLEIIDLALTKDLITSPSGIVAGDVVVFSFTVHNQGNSVLTDVQLVDYIPSGFSLDATASAGWMPSANGAVYTVASLASQADTTIEITLTFDPQAGTDFVNYGEITSASDDQGNDVGGSDADSSPGNNFDETDRELPGSTGDGNIDVDGSNGVEDDNDPAAFGEFDLALSKSIDLDPAGYKYGETVSFDITVVNEGTLAASNVTVVDRLPCGLAYLTSNNGVWTYDAGLNIATAMIGTTIVPGDSATVSIQLALTYCADPESYVNVSEITAATTPDGEPVVDVDSTPDNDSPSEDDQDTSSIPVVDLALTKRTITTDFAIGSPVRFEIEVYNQGSVALDNIQIVDYLPAGYNLNDPAWSATLSGDITTTLTGSLAPGTSRVVELNTTLVRANTAVDYVNYVEIAGFTGADGMIVPTTDSDSNPSSNTALEQSVVVDGPDDDNIIGGGPLANEDEDDHDVGGFDPFGSIGDFVWKDLDYDGIQDTGEPGIAGVTVSLQTCFGVTIATVESDADGAYTFDPVLLGDYQLVFDLGDVDGCISTLQDQGPSDDSDSDIDETGTTDCFTVEPGDFVDNVDAGFAGLADVGDFVWEDLDGDGLQDSNEPGIAGVTVTLFDQWGNPELTTTTDVQGFYLFEDVSVGRYYMRFRTGDPLLLPTVDGIGNNRGRDSNLDNSNGDGTTAMFDLRPNDENLSIDAGFYRCVTICGKTWYDLDEDSRRDGSENGVNGMLINVYRQGLDGRYDLVASDVTGAQPNTPSGDGYFEVCVRPGRYYVEVPLPPYGLVLARVINTGNSFTNNDVGSFNGPATTTSFSLRSGEGKCDIGAGFYPMATVGRLVWRDNNGDGIRTAGEPVVENVLVEAFDEQGSLVNMDVTGSDGTYEINQLQEQSYYLAFTPPAGYSFTIPRVDPNGTDVDSDVDHSNGIGTTRLISFTPGDDITDVDAGLAQGVLPVVWGDISLQTTPQGHLIRWSTIAEVNAMTYQVQRSINDDRWQSLGEVDAKNAVSGADYQWTDRYIDQSGIYTYRLEQFDLDGQSAYSPSVQTRVDTKGEVLLYPNPATTLTALSLPSGSEARVIVTGQDGSMIYEQTVALDATNPTLHDIDVTMWPAGVYQLTTIIGDIHTTQPLLVVR